MRLDKFLADQNIGTRSQIKDMVRKGFVRVNGDIVKKSDIQIQSDKDTISVNGEEICMQKAEYIMLHKPAGVVSATNDQREKTVIDLLPAVFHKNYFPVGRLDKDTEGLLLITSDGALAHHLLSPKHHVDKTYYVEVNGNLTEQNVSDLENGVDIGDDKLTLPAKVDNLQPIKDGMSFQLTITEGRFHQIKRMVKAIGLEVTYLKRLSMGSLTLDSDLPKGSYRALSEMEIQALQEK